MLLCQGEIEPLKVISGFVHVLDASSLFNEVPNKDEVDESVQERGKSANFPNRPPITYTPTSNDSNNLPGFDLTAGNEWHYPVGVELRTYQFVIAERCLYQNCLVCVPTGLGKTLIAAVVLHNFLRWYPTGCVIFMAPTRPLVSQQMAACRDFTGLSISGRQTAVAVELTGTTSPQQRAALWNGPHRAFFLTPQVIVNDLATGICPATSIRCVVIDEAHKATGNHAYCQVIRSITGTPYNHRQFRVVALSATPASDLLGAQAVIANLLIAHLEVRTESSPDVREYCHRRAIETIVVCLDPQLSDFKKRLCDLARPPFQRLCEHRALWAQNPKRRPHPEGFAPFTLVKARESFTRSHSSSPFFGVVLRDFRLATCFARALQLLTQYGLRPVYQYLLTNIGSSIELAQVSGLQEFITDLGSALGVTETTSVMSQLPLVAGHPKLLKLRDVLIEHFTGASERCLSQLGTRAIVFTQYRDSVSDIMHTLKAYSPTLRPAVFVGQSSSSSSEDQHNSKKRNTQRDQLQVMQMFREGRVNILISTCIGEEGLDVGQVDLIVCFDAPRSPARLIQRLGRTGRKRSGRVVVLLTQGREQANFALSMARSNTVHDALLQGQAAQKLIFYPHNPRMVPLGVNPSPVLWEPSIHSKTDTFASHNVVANCRKRYPTPPPHLRFPVFEASTLLSLGQEGMENNKTFTQRYSVNRWISSIRESFQTEFSGPSTTTWHLVASLRLLELHRRGQTHAMYHAMGIRKVDMISSLSDLPLSMSQFTHATLGGPVELSLPPASQDLPKPTPLVNSSVRFFRGLVSKSLMVDPRIHVFGELNLPDVVPIRGITLEGLDKGLEGMIASGIASPTHECQPTIHDSAFGLSVLLSSASFRPPSPVNPPPAKKLHTMTNKQEAVSGVSNAIDDLQLNLKLRLSDDLYDFLNSC
ncbi:Fanconi anemia group M protein [Taenia solium]|eukprot:TsM_000690000 transcript=TsM_000690000 gene=TsM_000690000